MLLKLTIASVVVCSSFTLITFYNFILISELALNAPKFKKNKYLNIKEKEKEDFGYLTLIHFAMLKNEPVIR